MPHNEHGPERLRAHDCATAVLSQAAGLAERLQACGQYRLTCRGPRPQDRARYCRLRDLLDTGLLPADQHDIVAAEFAAIELEELWADTIDNLVTTAGKNHLLDNYLAASSFTVTGPYMGLVNGSPTPAAGDTMSSHSGWTEAGNANAPAYTAPRKTVTFSSASSGSKASTGTYTYAFTSGGTVGGAFMVLGSGAVSTIDNTSGTLFSCGAFTGGNKTVSNGDSLTATWSLGV
jgi:hypothetical protein